MSNLVTAIYNTITTEAAAAYKEARTVSKVVEGAATKADYLDGIRFINGKGIPMTDFPKAAENRREDIMYLKALCNIYGPDIDNRILKETLEFQFCLMLLQSMKFTNEDIRPISGSTGKGKRKKKDAGTLMGLLKDYVDDEE